MAPAPGNGQRGDGEAQGQNGLPIENFGGEPYEESCCKECYLGNSKDRHAPNVYGCDSCHHRVYPCASSRRSLLR